MSVNLAKRQGAHLDCDEFDVAIPGVMPRDLKHYWTRGPGALKIRWGTNHSFPRCVRLLRKYFPQNPQGLCARLEKAATGHWPAEKIIDS